MTPGRAAAVLHEIAALLEVVGDDPFRARAFASAARALEGSDYDLDAMAAAGTLTRIPGVGSSIAQLIAELVESGVSAMHRRLVQQSPPGLRDVMRVKGLGPRKVRTLYAELGIDSLDALEAAAASGRLGTLPGFGARTAAKILESVAFVRASRGRRRLQQALPVSRRLVEHLRGMDGVTRAELAGEVRRCMETAEAVELVAAVKEPEALLDAFSRLGTDPTRLPDGRLEVGFADAFVARLACAAPEHFGAAVAWWTGSTEHVAALAERAEKEGLRFSAAGLFRGQKPVKTRDEEALYAALGLPWIPPEMREGLGEVELAERGELPELVRGEDLRGTFHCHTTYSDGSATLAEMAEAARARGWSYLGIADHSPLAGYAGGLSAEDVVRQNAEVDEWNRAHGGRGRRRFRVFKGTESDIRADGALDYPDEVLASFDYVVGSVHSAFALPEREQTDRLIRAVSNPYLTILGHATGRLLLGRAGYAVDVRAVIDAAAHHGTAIEINADPHRLDLDWRHARYAAGKGVLVPIDPDAHSVSDLDFVEWGVAMARKAWLTPRSVLNTRELKEVEEYLAERVQARAD